MSLKKYFLYDKNNSNFIPVEYHPLERFIYSACIWIIGGVVLCGLGTAILSKSIGTPAEIALHAENQELLRQLSQTKLTIQQYNKRLKKLATTDNEVYRSMLGMDPIPNDVREAGAGGDDIYSKFDVYDESTADILKWTAENLEKMKRSIDIQQASFENIKKHYNANRERFSHIPAIKPVKGMVTSGFGMRFHPILKYRRMHEGLDFTASLGTKVFATADGVIKRASRDGTFGNLVIIDHGYGYETYYAHLSAFAKGIKPGHKVNRGDIIAYSGETGQATGPHLHYEVHKNGKAIDPINFLFANISPIEYLHLKRAAENSTRSMD